MKCRIVQTPRVIARNETTLKPGFRSWSAVWRPVGGPALPSQSTTKGVPSPRGCVAAPENTAYESVAFASASRPSAAHSHTDFSCPSSGKDGQTISRGQSRNARHPRRRWHIYVVIQRRLVCCHGVRGPPNPVRSASVPSSSAPRLDPTRKSLSRTQPLRQAQLQNS